MRLQPQAMVLSFVKAAGFEVRVRKKKSQTQQMSEDWSVLKRGRWDDQVERPADGSLCTSARLKAFNYAGSERFPLQAADQLTLDGHVRESLPPARGVATAARRLSRFVHLSASSDREGGKHCSHPPPTVGQLVNWR